MEGNNPFWYVHKYLREHNGTGIPYINVPNFRPTQVEVVLENLK